MSFTKPFWNWLWVQLEALLGYPVPAEVKDLVVLVFAIVAVVSILLGAYFNVSRVYRWFTGKEGQDAAVELARALLAKKLSKTESSGSVADSDSDPIDELASLLRTQEELARVIRSVAQRADRGDANMVRVVESLERGDVAAARRALEEAVEEERNDAVRSAARIASAYKELAAIALLQNDTSAAVDAYRQALSHEPKDADTSIRLASLLFVIGSHDETETIWQSVLSDHPMPASPKWHAVALGRLGMLSRTRGDLSSAHHQLSEALKISKRVGDTLNTTEVLRDLAALKRTRRDFKRAERLIKQALDIDNLNQDQLAAALDNWLLAVVLRDQRRLQPARSALKSAEANMSSLKIENPSIKAKMLFAGASIALGLGEREKAEQLLGECLELNKSTGDQEGLASCYGLLSELEQAKGRLDRAEELIRQSLKINTDIGRLKGVARDHKALSKIYRRMRQFGKADHHADAADTIFNDLRREDESRDNRDRKQGGSPPRRAGRRFARKGSKDRHQIDRPG